MPKSELKNPELYINRELSWLEFNDRVLREGLNEELPLLERLKFLAIVSSNLDEFFMIRVAGLMQAREAGVRRRDVAGLTPAQQLEAICLRTHRMMAEQAAGIRRAVEELAGHGIHVLEAKDWTAEQQKWLKSFFAKEVLPVLTPLAVEQLDPCPVLPGLQLHVGLVLKAKKGDEEREAIAVLPVPTVFSRFITVPAEGGLYLTRLEDVIAANAGEVFPGHEVLAAAAFRITRDADVAIQDDDASDLLQIGRAHV